MTQLSLNSVSRAAASREIYRRRLMAAGMEHRYPAVKKNRDVNHYVRALSETLSVYAPRLGRPCRPVDVITALSELPEKVADYPVVSMDFFDTLVIRQAGGPETIQRKVAEISGDILSGMLRYDISGPCYAGLRGRAERALRDAAQDRGGDHETTLPAIINAVLSYLGIRDDRLCMRLADMETELECDSLQLNAGASALLQALKARKKRVIVVSDMYLSAPGLQRIAAALGIDGFIDRYYVSGDVGYAKHSGRMFGHVMRSEGVSACDIIHVGDNYHSDYAAARQSGIAACWLLQKPVLSERAAAGKKRGEAAGKSINRYIRSAYRHTTARSALSHAFYHVIAPAVFSQAYQNIKDGIRLGVRRFYFLAREGIAFKAAYDLLLRKHPEFAGLETSTHTLYISRASSVCARYAGTDDVRTIIASVYERFGTLSYGNLLKTWSVPDADTGLAPGFSPRITCEADVHALFADKAFARSFDACVSKQKNALRQYLRQEGVFDDACFFVDVGWAGTIQKNVLLLGPEAEIFGAYAGTYRRSGEGIMKGYLFSEACSRTKLIVKAAPLLEEMLSCGSTGSTLGYRTDGDKVLPVFADGNGGPSRPERVRNAVFEAFCPLFIRLTRDYAFTSEELTAHASEQLYHFIAFPDRGFMREIREINFQYNWGEADSHRIIMSVKRWHIFTPRRLYQEVSASPWCFATLKVSGLGLLNPLARLAARCDPELLRKMMHGVRKLASFFKWMLWL